jgi:hypothetical protein
MILKNTECKASGFSPLSALQGKKEANFHEFCLVFSKSSPTVRDIYQVTFSILMSGS